MPAATGPHVSPPHRSAAARPIRPGLAAGVMLVAFAIAVGGVIAASGIAQAPRTPPAGDTSTRGARFTANPTRVKEGETSVVSFAVPWKDLHNVRINGFRPKYTCNDDGCAGEITVTPVQTMEYVWRGTDGKDRPHPEMKLTITVDTLPPMPSLEEGDVADTPWSTPPVCQAVAAARVLPLEWDAVPPTQKVERGTWTLHHYRLALVERQTRAVTYLDVKEPRLDVTVPAAGTYCFVVRAIGAVK